MDFEWVEDFGSASLIRERDMEDTDSGLAVLLLSLSLRPCSGLFYPILISCVRYRYHPFGALRQPYYSRASTQELSVLADPDVESAMSLQFPPDEAYLDMVCMSLPLIIKLLD